MGGGDAPARRRGTGRRVRRRADGVLEIVPARRRDVRETASGTIGAVVVVALLAAVAVAFAPLLYLAPALAIPAVLRSLRARDPAPRRPRLALVPPGASG